MKLGEAALAAGRGKRSGEQNARQEQPGTGTQREIVARQRIRSSLNRSSLVYWALQALTLLMELDVILLGSLRTGPYYVLAEKRRT